MLAGADRDVGPLERFFDPLGARVTLDVTSCGRRPIHCYQVRAAHTRTATLRGWLRAGCDRRAATLVTDRRASSLACCLPPAACRLPPAACRLPPAAHAPPPAPSGLAAPSHSHTTHFPFPLTTDPPPGEPFAYLDRGRYTHPRWGFLQCGTLPRGWMSVGLPTWGINKSTGPRAPRSASSVPGARPRTFRLSPPPSPRHASRRADISAQPWKGACAASACAAPALDPHATHRHRHRAMPPGGRTSAPNPGRGHAPPACAATRAPRTRTRTHACMYARM